MATDTCEHLAAGPLSLCLSLCLSLSLTHTLQAAQNHMCIFQSGWMQWKLVFSMVIITLCRLPFVSHPLMCFAHKIPPSSWRPPGHNQSGPGVKIILSLVQRRTLEEGLMRQEGELSRTWWNPHERDAEYTHLFVTPGAWQMWLLSCAPVSALQRLHYVSSESFILRCYKGSVLIGAEACGSKLAQALQVSGERNCAKVNPHMTSDLRVRK